MSFCPNCGAPLDGDEKFCSKCGANLANNAEAAENAEYVNSPSTPSDNTQYAYNQQIIIKHAGPSPFTLALREIGKELWSFAKAPVDYVSSLKNELSKLSTILLCSIIGFLLVMNCFWDAMKLKKLLFGTSSSLTQSSLDSLLKSGDFSNLLTLGGFKLSSGPNSGLIFLISLVYVILIIALVWGVTLLINKLILNSQSSPLYILNKGLFSIVPVVIFSYLATILSYADGTISSLFNLFGVLLTSILLFKSINNNTSKSENLTLYLFLIFPIVIVIFNILFFNIIGSDYSALFGAVIYARH